MNARLARRLARGIFIVSAGLMLVAVALTVVTEPSQLLLIAALSLALGIYGGVGMLMASKHPTNPLGWLFCGVGAVLGSMAFAISYANLGSTRGLGSGTAPASEFAAWFALLVPPAALAFSLPVFLMLFPDGRLLSRRWKAGVALAAVASGLWILGLIAEADGFSELPVPEWIDVIPRVHDFAGAAGVATIAAALAGFASLVLRYRAAEGEARTQLQFLTMMIGAMAVVTVLAVPLSWFGLILALLVDGFGVLVGIPAATAVAVFTFGLYDVGFVVRKTIVSGLLTAAFVALFALLIVMLSGIAGDLWFTSPDSSVGLVFRGLVIGLAVWPLRLLAVRLSQRIVFGGRATPYEVLARFSGRLGETYATDDVLVRLAGMLFDAVGAQEAGVWLRLGDSLRLEASVPTRATETRMMVGDALPDTLPGHAFEVRDRGELLGAITVVMPANDPMNKAKEGLVHDLASQTGLVLRNVQLIAELRESRRRIVASQDERAKKLERNIHDGAQQQLVALSVKLRLAEQLVDRDVTKVKEMLGQIQADAAEALEDLRDLARGIYPPLLADKGLVAALDSQARKVPVPTTLEANGIGRFPQDAETAVYFCCLEALQNIAKYANASHVSVHLTDGDGNLTFSVTDDGEGFDMAIIGYGTGLQGMADRLAALDGTLRITSSPGEGTNVAGSLPTAAVGGTS